MRGMRTKERGASLVVLVLAMVALLGMAALAIDVGVLYTARAQCQNAADSGALACAGFMTTIKLNPGAVNKIKNKGVEYANYNKVLSQPVNIGASAVSVDLNRKSCRVCVARTTAGNNPVPTFFGRILGRNTVDISACATAEIANAKVSNCIKPWALPDAFVDSNGNNVYNSGEYYEQGVTSYGTNYRNNGYDVGVALTVRLADPTQPVSREKFFAVDLPNPNSPGVGADRYRDNITNCNPTAVSIGDTLQIQGGELIGPTRQGVDDLINSDPNAYWDSTNGQVGGSSYGAAGSPRIIRIVFFDPRVPPTSGRSTFIVANIASLFLEGVDGDGGVISRVMLTQGHSSGGSGGLQYVRITE